MTWRSSYDKNGDDHGRRSYSDKSSSTALIANTCPSCGQQILIDNQANQDLSGLPAGVKFDPTDQELLEHLEGKTWPELLKLHPLIDEFIPTIEGDNGICYTHPEKLPGVNTNGLIRHFFHRPSKAYTTGKRKRRKVHDDEQGGDTRWHKTGKTRPIFSSNGIILKGHKKILVLYTNYNKHKKPEKTNWVMHQYHLGSDDDEKDGELVVSKVFYQTQPRQCTSTTTSAVSTTSTIADDANDHDFTILRDATVVAFYGSSILQGRSRESSPNKLMHNFVIHDAGSTILD